MPTAIVHIGMHKTGSSSIQRALRAYDGDAFCYPRIGRKPSHNWLPTALSATGEHQAKALAQKTAKRLEDRPGAELRLELERIIAQASSKPVIISSEGIYCLPLETLDALKTFLDRNFSSYEIASYVRPPASFITSVFQQSVRSNHQTRFNVSNAYPRYRERFERFDQLFGRSRVKLWKYEPAMFPDGDIVRDFCSRLSLPAAFAGIRRANDAVPREIVKFCFILNRFAKARNVRPEQLRQAKRAMLEALRGLSAERFRISPDLLRPLLQARHDDIAWMEDRLSQSLEEDLGGSMDGDIATEADLLRPDPALVSKLRDMAGRKAPPGVSGATPDEVALLALALVKPALAATLASA